MKKTIRSVLSLCACLSATAGEFAFHFNKADDFKVWQISSQKLEPLTPAKEYAIFDANCLRFKTPKWEKGMPEWPSCQAKPLIVDWTPYDRLLLDITNPHPESQRLSLFISDSKIPFRKALGDGFTLEGNSCTRCVVQLSKFPKTVDRKDISILHLFTQRPAADMDIFIADAIPTIRPPTVAANIASQSVNTQFRIIPAMCCFASTQEQFSTNASSSSASAEPFSTLSTVTPPGAAWSSPNARSASASVCSTLRLSSRSRT